MSSDITPTAEKRISPVESQKTSSSSPSLEEKTTAPGFQQRESYALLGLRFLFVMTLFDLLRHVISLFAFTPPPISPGSFHPWMMLFNSTNYILGILGCVTMYFLWRGGTNTKDRWAGMLLFLLQLATVLFVFWANSNRWVPGFTNAKVPAFVRYGSLLLLSYGIPLAYVCTATRLAFWPQATESPNANRLRNLSWGVAFVSLLSMLSMYLRMGFGGSAKKMVSDSLVALHLPFSLVMLVSILILAILMVITKQSHYQKKLQEHASWLKGYLNLRMIFVLLFLQLSLGLFLNGVTIWAILKKSQSSIHLFAQTFPSNSLFIGLCLVLCLWGGSRAKESKGASIWFIVSSLFLAVATTLNAIVFIQQFSRLTQDKLLTLMTPAETWMTGSASLLSWLTLLFFLSALRHIARDLQEHNLARRISNLRWILVGFSSFSGIILILFAAAMGKAGFLFYLFVGFCIFTGGVMLLMLVFVNIFEISKLIERERLLLEPS